MRLVLPILALLAALGGNVVPVLNLLDLWSVPVGTGVRPMTAPGAFLLWGCGTPLIVTGLAIAVFTTFDVPTASFWQKAIPRVLAILACLIAFVPLVLTTYGVYWVIQTRNLWLKP